MGKKLILVCLIISGLFGQVGLAEGAVQGQLEGELGWYSPWDENRWAGWLKLQLGGDWSLGEDLALFLRGSSSYDSTTAEPDFTLERAYLRYETGKLRLNLGRQAVSWGVGWFFRPTDLITPLTPLSKEETRPGQDLLRLTYATSAVTNLEALGGEELLAARYEWRIKKTNLRLLGLVQSGAKVVGLDFQGGLAGFYGEAAYGFTDELNSGFWTSMLGYRKIFKEDWNGYLEYLHDASGAADPAQYDYSLLAAGSRRYLGQDYLALGLVVPWDDLTDYTGAVVVNLRDQGLVLSNYLNVAVSENLDLKAGAILVMGAAETEFGQMAAGQKVILSLGGVYYL